MPENDRRLFPNITETLRQRYRYFLTAGGTLIATAAFAGAGVSEVYQDRPVSSGLLFLAAIGTGIAGAYAGGMADDRIAELEREHEDMSTEIAALQDVLIPAPQPQAADTASYDALVVWSRPKQASD